MRLNVPIELSGNIMVVGMGGGFDVFAALPLIYNNPEANYVLVNYSPQSDFLVRNSLETDYPQGLITDYPVISVGRHGYKLVLQAYQHIYEQFDIGTVLAIDGGVDSLMQGDEYNAGTVLEDFISLAAIQQLGGQRILVTTGFGTETEEDLNHYRVLENMSELIKDDFFIGSCSLTKQMPAYKRYKETCERVMAQGRKSHIQTKLIKAIEGEFANSQVEADARVYEPSNNPNFISPLMSIYWFFNLVGVAAKNKVIEPLKKSNTFVDARIIFKNSMSLTRNKLPIPL